MSENDAAASTAGERVAIGITFGNSNSSIAYTIDDKAEVIANEDGGRCIAFPMRLVKADNITSAQTDKYPRYCPTSTATSTTAARRRPSSSAILTTLSHTSRSS